jgi:HSP20 family molecular chaperone IbpA
MNRLATRTAGSFPWFGDIGRNLLLNAPLFDNLDDYFTDVKFPKYNIVQTGIDLTLEVALAGYNKDDLSVELSPDNILTLSSKERQELTGDDAESDTANKSNRNSVKTYIKRGIAERNFTISWNIGSVYDVGDITYENGMLGIILKSKAPEKPKIKLLKIK